MMLGGSLQTVRKMILMLVPVGCLALLWAIMAAQPAQAATVTPGICRATIVFDRSGSVSETELRRLRAQTSRLFDVGGLYDDKIEVGFWSFASSLAANYNNPFHPHVSSKGQNASFNRAMARLESKGSTNYEHGFAYNNGVRNQYIKDVIDKTDVIAFLTDGLPNADTPANRRAAVLKHYADGRTIVGGLIGTSKGALAEAINGSSTDYTNLFTISADYSDLYRNLKQQIGEQCGIRNPYTPCKYNAEIPADDPRCVPPAALPYSLVPTTTASSSVISGTDSAALSYKIQNRSEGIPSTDTRWKVSQLVVKRGQSVDALSYGSDEYRDGYGCANLIGLVGGPSRATCTDVIATGNKVFAPGETVLGAGELGAAAQIAVDDSWEVGTKVCYVLSVDKPTEKDTPVNRFSKAACLTVGIRPTFQVHGGDVSVGRHFAGDTITTGQKNVRGSVTMKTGAINKTFGSWTEYGVFAPGIVSGVATASGLQGGYDGRVASNQELWSRLTFANAGGTYGNFTTDTGMGAITNMAEYFTRGRAVARELNATSDIDFKGDVASGLYRKQTGSLTINESMLEKGKLVIVYVPGGTVTINGNISYAGGPYGSVKELPQMIIIAQNIMINGGVSNIDAWLFAQDAEGRGGTIATCEQVPPLSSENCNTPLRVNGPVAAKNLLLRRTGGSGSGNASGDPAEIFNIRGDVYLWAYNEGRSGLRAQTTNTIELPPQF